MDIGLNCCVVFIVGILASVVRGLAVVLEVVVGFSVDVVVTLSLEGVVRNDGVLLLYTFQRGRGRFVVVVVVAAKNNNTSAMSHKYSTFSTQLFDKYLILNKE